MEVGLRRVLAKLDRSGPPAYAQIEGRFAEAIAGGELKPGERLPPERELAKRLGVSRMTLRQSLDALEREGLVARAVGRRGGTFVAEPKIERDLTALAGLTQELRRQGHEAGARVLAAEEAEASRAAANALRIKEGVSVFEVTRLRLSDGKPLALERSMFPADRFPGLLELPLDGSLYEILARNYDEPPRRAVERLEPVVAERADAAALGVKRGAPLLLVERVAYGEADAPLEWAKDVFRGDRIRAVVHTHLDAESSP